MSNSPPNLERPDSGKGKAPASPEKQQPQQIDFEFLNFSHPSEAKASRARRTVRSHVTRQQHQREQAAAQATRRASVQSQSIGGVTGSFQQRPPRLKTSQSANIQPDQTPPEVSPEITSRSEPSSSVTSTFPSPLQSPSEPLADPFEAFPQEWRSSIPLVIDYFAMNLALANQYLDADTGQNLSRQIWLPFALSRPVLMSAVVLLAASHMLSTVGPDTHTIDTIALRGMVIRGINDTLHDTSRSLSDELFGTIIVMASFETLHGEREAYAMHMSGLQKLVEMRGGLERLGLDGLLERLLLWTDCNASYLAGTNSFFPQQRFPTRSSRPRGPDLHSFYPRHNGS